MAGMESTAKTMSVVSTSTNTASRGVAMTSPPLRTSNRWPWKLSVMGTTRRNAARTLDWSGLRCSSRWRIIRKPVYSRNAAKRYNTHEKLWMSAAPPAMKIPRNTRAPSTPGNRTRCWNWGGTAKWAKMIAQRKTLSTARDFSMR